MPKGQHRRMVVGGTVALLAGGLAALALFVAIEVRHQPH